MARKKPDAGVKKEDQPRARSSRPRADGADRDGAGRSAGSGALGGKWPLPAGDLRMSPPPSGVTVRMYRTGLGDCFLLCFPRRRAQGAREGTERPVFVLIDCGVFRGTPARPNRPEGADRINLIARHIHAATNDRADRKGTSHLDLLVITHEHWDHVSGFHPSQAQDVFAQFEVGEVWLPWTEDHTDPLSLQLRHIKVSTVKVLQHAYKKLAAREGGDGTTVRRVQTALHMMGFGGAAGEPGALGADGFDKDDQTGQALKWIKEHFERVVRFRQPGPDPDDDGTLDGLDGARFYVLGPPKDEVLIHRLNPHERDDEAYAKTKAMAAAVASSFFAAFGAMPGEPLAEAAALGDDDARIADERRLRSRPFEDFYRVEATPPEPKGRHSISGHARPERDEPDPLPTRTAYYDPEHDWRRIDVDWLAAAGEFALNVDGLANNSSLVLAIELSPGGRVLLFAGDAQIGNWLSWFGKVDYPDGESHGKDMVWTLDDGRRVDARDLLARTVLYKVGHHGSHNATLKRGGLEVMGSRWPDEFIAMLSVDENVARNHTTYGEMPLTSLVYELLGRTDGRLLRTDEGIPPEASTKHSKLSPTIEGVLDRKPLEPGRYTDRKDDPSEYRLYFDYTIHD